MKNSARLAAMLWSIAATLVATAAAAEPLTIDQVIAQAVKLSPEVHAARARWESAAHSILQKYAPEDPTVGLSSLDSPTNGFTAASQNAYEIGESFQFPGKALLQGSAAKRSAEMARLGYEAVLRDVRTTAATQFYQLFLDDALKNRLLETIADLKAVATATGPKDPKANREAIAAEITEEQQNIQRLEQSRGDDEIRLNALLRRGLDQRIETTSNEEIAPISDPLQELTDRSWSRRQEILQAALAAQNAETALALAKLQYAPDFTVGYAFNHYKLESDAPGPGLTQTHSVWVGFNLPLFFWMKQQEEVTRAGYDLEAAREDLESVRIDTAAEVAVLYRHAQFDYREAVTYRDSIIPNRKDVFQNALVAYRQNGEYLAELVHVRVQLREARSSFLEAAARLMQDRIGLEQQIGEPLRMPSH